MRAITLWQPWASQPFDRFDPKDVENRTTLRPPPELYSPARLDGRRPFFAIHAGLKYDPSPAAVAAGGLTREAARAAGRWAFPDGVRVPPRERCPLGAVVGVVRLVYAWDSRTMTALGYDDAPSPARPPAENIEAERWWLGPIGWRLEHAIPIKPVEVRGALGCWTLPDAIAREVALRAASCVDKELEDRAYEGAPGAPSTHADYLPKIRVIDLVHASEDLWRIVREGAS